MHITMAHPREFSLFLIHTLSFTHKHNHHTPCDGRDCVLFGSPLDPARYARTIEACCLGPDVARLEAGHETEIGERGVTLSGGV